MTVESKDEFFKCLRASQLFPEEQLSQIIETHGHDDPGQCAKKMVAAKLLTPWQAKFIYSGRHKLRLGNYVLLERIRHDQLGDRFRARHESLDRRVEIQVLPQLIDDDKKLQADFIRHIGSITTLDHPNISHLHDVDRHGGRFILIDEWLPGVALKEANLDSRSLIVCIRDVLEALAFAHSQGLVHGDVTNENIIALENGRFKIRGLALSFLRDQITKRDSPTAREDLIAFAEMAIESFQELPQQDQIDFRWLRISLNELRSEPTSVYPRVIAATSKTIESWDQIESSEEIVLALADSEDDMSDLVTESDVLPESGSSFKSAPSQSAKSSGSPSEVIDEEDVSFPPSSVSSKGVPEEGSSTKSTALTLYAGGGFAVVALLTLLLLWVGGAFSPKPPNDDTTAASQSQDKIAKQNEEKALKALKGEAPKIDSNEIKAALAKARGEENSKDDGQKQPTQDKPIKKVVNENMKKNEESERTENQPPPAKNGAKPTTPVDPKDKTNQKPNKQNASATTEGSDIFAGWAEQIDLPATDSAEPFLVGKVGQTSEPISISLISSPKAFRRGKGAFELKSTTPNTWNVFLLGKAGAKDKTPVGQFTLRENQLEFVWDGELGKRSRANSLRNCILQLSAGDKQKEIGLRTPTELPAIALTAKKYQQRIRTSIDWLPVNESIRIEMAKPKDPWPRNIYVDAERQLPEPFVFDANLTPLAMKFDRLRADQTLSVAIQPTIKSNLEFNVSVFARGKNTEPISLDSFGASEDLIKTLNSAKRDLLIRKNQAELAAEQAPFGERTRTRDFANSVKKEYKAVTDNLEIAREISDKLKSLHDAGLEFTVYYELDGRRVIIATTPAIQ